MAASTALASPVRTFSNAASPAFGAKPSGRRIPSLRSWMTMFGRHIARIGDAFRVLSRVLFASLHEDRTDFRHADTTGRTPSSVTDGEQPDFPESLNDRSARSLRYLRRSTVRERVQMPEHFRSGQLSKWLGYYEPASNVSPRSFADGKTCATRRCLARRGRHLNQEHQQQEHSSFSHLTFRLSGRRLAGPLPPVVRPPVRTADPRAAHRVHFGGLPAPRPRAAGTRDDAPVDSRASRPRSQSRLAPRPVSHAV